jgi:hypothetical protein
VRTNQFSVLLAAGLLSGLVHDVCFGVVSKPVFLEPSQAIEFVRKPVFLEFF